MRSQALASLSCHRPTLPASTFLPHPTAPRDSIPSLFKRRPIPRPSSSIRSLDDRDHHRAAIGYPEPPWLVHSPAAPENPFSAWPSLPDLPVKVSGTGIPFSLRLVQLKKRRARDISTSAQGSSLESAAAGRAVSALAFTIGELQSTVFVGRANRQEVLEKVSRDRNGSFAWLFRRVFSSSPNLVVHLLILMSRFLYSSTINTMGAAEISSSAAASEDGLEGRVPVKGPEEEEEEEEKEEAAVAPNSAGDIHIGDHNSSAITRGFRDWTDIGIEEGIRITHKKESVDSCIDRRRHRMYERNIAIGNANSLILSNYAQFLYRVANDHDRAAQYFQWAVVAEPRDAEAMSRYALFLWEERGDITAAEEMFLEAIDADPGNHYHSSSYARFLFQTGASDTYYPLNPSLPEEM